MSVRRIICGPDGFKDSLTAVQAAEAMGRGIADANQDLAIDTCPIADGGEGTLEVLAQAAGGAIHHADVLGPRLDTINARFATIGEGTAGVIALSEASGLDRLTIERRDPMRTTTYGTGQLIDAANRFGCRDFIVCIGGSATCDGGAGLAQALGWRFYDSDGALITRPLTGAALSEIARIEPWAREDPPNVRVACDVTNPLLGPDGAAVVYAPQKGATPAQVELLEAGLANLAALCRPFSTVDPQTPGAGAAGGAGFGLMTFLAARLERGIGLVLEAVDFRRRCQGAALVLTGEGRLDAQSLRGKACLGVSRVAHDCGVPTIAIVGTTGAGSEGCVGEAALKRYVSMTERVGRERAWGMLLSRCER